MDDKKKEELLETYEFGFEIVRIGNEAVHEVQEKNRKLGIPNVYGLNGNIIYEYPDGTITTKSPW